MSFKKDNKTKDDEQQNTFKRKAIKRKLPEIKKRAK